MRTCFSLSEYVISDLATTIEFKPSTEADFEAELDQELNDI